MSFPATRMRRLRSSEALRELVAEVRLDPHKLVWPLFVVPGRGVKRPISSLPKVFQLSSDEIVTEAKEASQKGIRSLLLFGVPDAKDERGEGAIHDDGLIPQTIRMLKDVLPEMLVMTDVCLCAYTTHGHCGVVDNKGVILNDPSLEMLATMAVAHARAGADIVAPSDMMDGRVAALRKGLDGAGFASTPIMSYAAKYASSFYGPFREAAHSAPAFGDRRSYQMDPSNAREALREMELDVEEGADMVMIKPALSSLDVIAAARRELKVPIAAYQVSGEYAMIKAAAERGWIDGQAAMHEALLAIRRAGADIIVTYAAPDVVAAS